MRWVVTGIFLTMNLGDLFTCHKQIFWRHNKYYDSCLQEDSKILQWTLILRSMCQEGSTNASWNISEPVYIMFTKHLLFLTYRSKWKACPWYRKICINLFIVAKTDPIRCKRTTKCKDLLKVMGFFQGTNKAMFWVLKHVVSGGHLFLHWACIIGLVPHLVFIC